MTATVSESMSWGWGGVGWGGVGAEGVEGDDINERTGVDERTIDGLDTEE
jgi:hypothetical protein